MKTLAQLKKENNGNLNIIHVSEKGYTTENIKRHTSFTHDFSKGKLKYYKSLETLKRYSRVFSKTSKTYINKGNGNLIELGA